MSMGPKDDESLLARLNALKPSSVVHSSNTAPISTNDNALTYDDVASRFRKLGGKPVNSVGTLRDSKSVPDDFGDVGDDDKSLDELLNEISGDHDWDIGGREEADVDSLLNEAEMALKHAETLRPHNVGGRPNSDTHTDSQRTANSDAHDGDEMAEHQEAEEHIRRVLAELRIKRRQNEERNFDSDSDTTSIAGRDESGKIGAKDSSILVNMETDFELPSAPVELPDVPNDEASLPSAPSSQLSKKKRISPTVSDYDLDDKIATWCSICTDDATVKCQGCDGDLFCASCWKEGHIGKYADAEERAHHWTKYNKNA